MAPNLILRTRVRFRKPSGVQAKACTNCHSTNISHRSGPWIRLPYSLPREVWPLADQMLRRDNGLCNDCRLEQAFYKFSDEGRKLFFKIGLDNLSADNEYHAWPPPVGWREQLYRQNFERRLPAWDALLKANGIRRMKRVLHLRAQYGEALDHFREKYGAEGWAMEMTHTCERFIREFKPEIKIMPGNLASRIEPSPDVDLKFDAVLCFHTLVHSVDLAADIQRIRSMLKPGGLAIFSDEIMKKPHNPFHMIHADEETLFRILRKHFGRVERIDDCGNPDANVTPFTVRGDNPDLVAWVGG